MPQAPLCSLNSCCTSSPRKSLNALFSPLPIQKRLQPSQSNSKHPYSEAVKSPLATDTYPQAAVLSPLEAQSCRNPELPSSPTGNPSELSLSIDQAPAPRSARWRGMKNVQGRGEVQGRGKPVKREIMG
jgi:hypothetical protein